MSFSSYASEPTVFVEEPPLPDDVEVLLGWKCSVGKYKGQTYGYVVTHDAEFLRKLLKWSKLEPRSRDLITRVLEAFDVWTIAPPSIPPAGIQPVMSDSDFMDEGKQ